MLDVLRIVALAATVNAIRLRDPAAGTYQKPIATYKTDGCAVVVTPPNPYPWTEDFFDGVKIDHFSATSKRAFRQRILYSNSTYKKGGPMFFYTGNEGDILSFAQNTGVIWNIASQFNAFVVFAEHRFYGESQPFPVQAAFSSADKLQYLTVEQALADYAALIPRIKQKYGLPNDTKVIAVGGSYGGMLSAWFRHTYPQVVDGAWAASAPVEYFATGTVPLGAFDKRTKDTLVEGGCDSGTIQDSFNAIDLIATRPTGYAMLNSAFNIDPKSLINSSARVQDLKDYVAEGLTYMAMTDYPYQSNFLENMTAWPVKVACQYLNGTEAGTNRELIIKMGKAIAVYYGNGKNCIDSTVCGDQGTSGLGANTDLAWSWQACTELILYSCEQGPPNDLFWQQCTNVTGSKNPPTFENWSKANCQLGEQGVKGYNATTMWNETKIPSKFGLDFAGASNIIFTNGNLDPWSPGGVKPSTPGFSDALKRNIFIYEIEGGAHHLDLREPNTCDPEPVRNVRWQIVKILKCWTGLRPASECTPVLLHEPVPPFSQANTTNCVTDAYPWGQGRPPVTSTSKHTTITTTKKHTVTTETTKTTTAAVHRGTESTKATAPARNHTSSGQTSPPGQSETTPKGAPTVVISLKVVLFSVVLSFFAFRH